MRQQNPSMQTEETLARDLKELIINRKALLLSQLPPIYRDIAASIKDTRNLWNEFHSKLQAISGLVKEFESLYDVPIEHPKEATDEEEEPEAAKEEEKPTKWEQLVITAKERISRWSDPLVFWWLRGYDTYKTFYKAWKRPAEGEKELPFRARYAIYRQQNELKRYYKQGIDPLVKTAEQYILAYDELLNTTLTLFDGQLIDIDPNPALKETPLEILHTATLYKKQPTTIWIETPSGPQPLSLLQSVNKTHSESRGFYATTLKVTRDIHLKYFLYTFDQLHKKSVKSITSIEENLHQYQKDLLSYCSKALSNVRRW